MKVEEIFTDELSQIKDDNILSFVLDCFDEICPDYFWTCPASISGKYHPQISLGKGGLIRHTKLAVWWGYQLIRACSVGFKTIPEQQLQDEVAATLLMHDMLKNGLDYIEGESRCSNVVGTHGVLLAKEIEMRSLGTYLDESTRKRIIAGIAGHMGIWTTDLEYRPQNCEPGIAEFVQLVHLSDYCAAKKVDMKIDFLLIEKSE
ncbi:MAG: hypothetical protein ACTSPI_02300 [Candidatus Heimdallarchaeaceae archaeon]